MKFDTRRLSNLMGDIDAQPDWRTPAKKCCAYYDGEQLPDQIKQLLKKHGQPELVYNLVKPTVNGVLGLEARTRVDMIITADDPNDEIEEMVQAVNEKFKDVRRICDADMAESDAYASQIKAGLGWIEIYRNPYPMQSPYKIKFVHRDEIDYDWNTKDRDLSDCRWLRRRRWVDYDEAYAMFPDKKDIIMRSINNDWEAFVGDNEFKDGVDPGYAAAWADYERWDRKTSEWLQPRRKRILMQTVYYAVIERKPMMKFESGRVEVYDPSNQVHNAFVASKRVQLQVCPVRYIREAWFVGPMKVRDKMCDAPQGYYPLVPYWGYRKDSNNMPYGMIADMITPQDAVNFRYIKLTAQLNHKTILMDKDATDMTRQQVKEEVHKVDGVVELNGNRASGVKISDVFQVQENGSIATQQFQLAKDSQEMIQQCAGVYNAMLGQGDSGQSGVAINSLIEQGSTTLSEINDNYRFGRLCANRLLMMYLFEDLKKQRDVSVTVFKEDPTRRKQVVINAVVKGERKLSNDISKLRAHVALAPIQQTPTFKAQMAQQLTQIVGTLPPEIQMATLDMILELMDIPNKQEFLARVRSAIGVKKDFEDMTPEEQQQAQAEAQQQAQQQQMLLRDQMADIAKKEAEAAIKQMQAQKEQRATQSMEVSDAKTQAETAKIISEMDQLSEEQIARNAAAVSQLDQALAEIAV